jgi:zinc protease
VLKDERVRESSWSRSYLAPGYTSGDGRRAYALEVMAEILSGGATARLYRSLVVEQQLMTSAGAYYSPDGMGPSRLVFYARPRPGTSMEAVEKAVEMEISKLLADGVTEEEMSKAKVRMEAEAIYARDSFRTGAQLMGAALTGNRTVEDVEAWPERIAAVTKEEISEAMRAVLDINRSVTGLLLPAKPTKDE